MKKHSVIKLLGTAVAGLMLLTSLWGCISEAAPSPTGTNTAAPTPTNTAAPGRVTPVSFDYDGWIDSLEIISPTFTPILVTSIPDIAPIPTANAELMFKGNVRPVLICSIGTGETQLGGYTPKKSIRGPQYFYVDDSGWMAILDTYTNRRIVIYDKTDDGTFAYREEIAVPSTGDTSQLHYVDGIFYLFHDRSNHIVSVAYEHGKDNSQNEVLWHLLPEPAHTLDPTEIHIEPLRDGNIYIYDIYDDTFKYVLKDGVFIESDGHEDFILYWDGDIESDRMGNNLNIYSLNTPIGSWCMVTRYTRYMDQIIGYDSHYNTYFYNESSFYYPEGEMITDDVSDDIDYQSFIKIDEHGNFLGEVSIPYSDFHQNMYRVDMFRVTLDGTIYYMMCFPEQVIVYEIT